MRRATHIFGLTGGLASGKSTVARMFQELGAQIIDADRLGHELLGAASPAYQDVLAEFGPGILDPFGEINRARLAALVFADPSRLAKLNAILHSRILDRIDEIAAPRRAANPTAVILVDAALIYEAGIENRFARIVVAWCRPEQQRERLRARLAVPADQIESRLAAQLSLDEKRRRADYVIDTSGSLESTRSQVVTTYAKLRLIDGRILLEPGK